jgi:RNA polymerase sigma-70 factor (ECF subfamily)
VADSDAALVERVRSGDQSAMRSLVERFQGIVFGLCYRMLSQREDAEDIAQDVFLRTFRSLGGWDPARPLKPWILTIAANRCRTFLSTRSRQAPAVEFAADRVAAPIDPDRNELAEELQLGMETLRDEYRLCVTLFYQQELGIAEIAEVLGCAQGTVKTWLHRARHQLAEHLQNRGVLPHAHAEVP